MDNLDRLFRHILQFKHRTNVPIDRAHNLFLVGAVLALKPREVLELGVGSGYVTESLVHALAYNRRGRLTTVDNWLDFKGVEPPGMQSFRNVGVQVVTMNEGDFVRSAPTDAYDLLVSDGDHRNSANWLDDQLRIVRNGGFLFFHDTNNATFPGLATIEPRLRERGLFCYNFHESSRPDELCERGWLFAVNSK